jgi:DNA polymerase III alpha subunit (gram-positive type)
MTANFNLIFLEKQEITKRNGEKITLIVVYDEEKSKALKIFCDDKLLHKFQNVKKYSEVKFKLSIDVGENKTYINLIDIPEKQDVRQVS